MVIHIVLVMALARLLAVRATAQTPLPADYPGVAAAIRDSAIAMQIRGEFRGAGARGDRATAAFDWQALAAIVR